MEIVMLINTLIDYDMCKAPKPYPDWKARKLDPNWTPPKLRPAMPVQYQYPPLHVPIEPTNRLN